MHRGRCSLKISRREKMEDTIQASIQVTTKDMFFFMLQHTYRSISGICGLLFSGVSLLVMIGTWGTVNASYTILLAICSTLFTIINPFMLYSRSVKQVALNPAIKTPITYCFGKLGFTMKQGKEEAQAQYRDLYKVRNTKNYIYLYGTGNKANIISKKQLKDQAQTVTEMVMKGYQAEN